MNRRGFLGTLLASLGTLAIDPKQLLWMPPTVSEGMPLLKPGAVVGLEQMTKQVAVFVGQRWQGRHQVKPVEVGPYRIGDMGQGRVIYDHQFHCALDVAPEELDEHGLDPDRYLRPAAAALAYRLNRVRASRMATLPTNGLTEVCAATALCVDTTTGVAVRGLAYYDIGLETGREQHLVRFDVLAA